MSILKECVTKMKKLSRVFEGEMNNGLADLNDPRQPQTDGDLPPIDSIKRNSSAVFPQIERKVGTKVLNRFPARNLFFQTFVSIFVFFSQFLVGESIGGSFGKSPAFADSIVSL
jgi:hypothetical protein